MRRWISWYRWVTLAMLALAFLAIAALAGHAQPPPAGLPPLTRNEVARLFASLIIQPTPRRQPPAGLVHLAPPPPAHRTHLPLPAASRHRPLA